MKISIYFDFEYTYFGIDRFNILIYYSILNFN